jgi:hypothetical protein
MTEKWGGRKRRKNWRHEPPPHDVYIIYILYIYCSDFLRLLNMNIKMGSLEPSNNEYAWARLLDIFTLGSYKKMSHQTFHCINHKFISVVGGGSNSLIMWISYRHLWNYNFTIPIWTRTNSSTTFFIIFLIVRRIFYCYILYFYQ